MEQEVKKLFTADILANSILKWGGKPENLKLLGELENFVYEFNDGQKNFILRITHSTHRKKELVLAELDWLNFLSAHSLPVCKPIISDNNLLIEIIELEDSYFIICAFEKAKGQIIYSSNPIRKEKDFIRH